MSPEVAVTQTVRGKLPRLPFEALARAAFGARAYELSLVVCGDSLARRVNKRWRGKTYAANVLSFPLSRHEGELFLNARQAEREARRYRVSPSDRLALLFVHGCLHLRGLSHGRTMEREERRILRAFRLSK